MLDQKALNAHILQMLKDIVLVQGTTSESETYTANQSKAIEVPITVPDGYALIGCVGVSASSGSVYVQAFYKNAGENKITVYLRNTSSSSISTTVSVRALFKRTT